MLRPELAERPWSVSELAQQIRVAIRPLASVLVKGEVSGIKRSARGHYSFTIKEGQAASVEAMIWADTVRRLPALPEDGQEFVFRGRVDFWPQGGRLRLIVDQLEFDDVGRMRALLERLKLRLEQEGAFDPGRKRPIPFLPRRVALITSPTGAVIHDLQETIWERFPNMEIVVYPAQVQGLASPASVAVALERCNRDRLADVVVIARGGGSFEELHAFNTEPVARAILRSAVPVVTALGHTSDRTLADMVADAECRTPTEAGARVVPRKEDLLLRVATGRRRVARELSAHIARSRAELDQRRLRFRQAVPALVERRRERLERLAAELNRLSPADQIRRRQEGLVERRARLALRLAAVIDGRRTDVLRRRAAGAPRLALHRLFDDHARSLEQRRLRLEALSPAGVLRRGYSIVVDLASGTVVRSWRETDPGRRLRVRLGEGALTADVREVEE